MPILKCCPVSSESHKRLAFLIFLMGLSSITYADTKIWTGGTSSNWNTAGNWSGGLPVTNDNITIDPSNYSSGVAPVISASSTFTPKNITIKNGGTLTVNTTLIVTGDITVTSGSSITTTDASNGAIYFNGATNLLGNGTFTFPSVIINNGKSLNQSEPTTIVVQGDWTNNGGIFVPNSNKVIFYGTIVQQINGTSINQTFYDFEITKTSQSLKTGGSLTTLNVHNFTQTSFKFHDSTLLTFNITGDFLHTSGTFVPCNTIYIAGNITENHNSSSGNLTWGTTVILNGSSAQTVGGLYPMSFNNLVINNTSSTGIILQQPTTIATALTLTDGYIYTDTTNLLIIKNNAASTVGSANSFVDGPVKKIGASPFIFPVGNAQVWARLEMVNDASFQNYSATTEFTCTYHKTPAPNNTYRFMSTDFDHVSFVEYWNLERTHDAGNDAKCNVRLYWEDTARSGITNLADLKVAHFSSSSNLYVNQGGSASASGKTGTITSTVPLTSFSPITFGSGSGANPLPIELLSFDAIAIAENNIELIWEVATEINNNYFTIERSADGIHFEEIKKVKGAGTTIQQHTYSIIDQSTHTGVSYYRLKQTDFDGKTTCFNTVDVELNNNKKDVVFYPNPLCTYEYLFLKTNENWDKTITINIIDVLGNTVCSKDILIKKGLYEANATDIGCNLSAGVYSITIVDGADFCSHKLIVK